MVTLIKQTFNCVWLIVQGFGLLPSWSEVWQHAGRCGIAEITETSTFQSIGSRKRESQGLA